MVRSLEARAYQQQGIALVAVLLFLLLAGSVAATFMYRSLSDGLIAGNRESAARAEALAQGGIEIAVSVLVQDRLDEAQVQFRAETHGDNWRRLQSLPIHFEDGSHLQIQIEDAGERLNLNSLFDQGKPRSPLTESVLIAFFERMADHSPESFRDHEPEELARNIIDWVDADELSSLGDNEDDYYQSQRPPYRTPNRPFLSIEELGLVKGFDPALMEQLRPYLSVYPWYGGQGINPNTAPPWILALLFHGTGSDFRFADESTIRAILDIRENGGILCADEANHPSCTPIREAIPDEIYPPPSFTNDVFRVVAQAKVNDVLATVEAMIDRKDPAHPQLLNWSIQ